MALPPSAECAAMITRIADDAMLCPPHDAKIDTKRAAAAVQEDAGSQALVGRHFCGQSLRRCVVAGSPAMAPLDQRAKRLTVKRPSK